MRTSTLSRCRHTSQRATRACYQTERHGNTMVARGISLILRSGTLTSRASSGSSLMPLQKSTECP